MSRLLACLLGGATALLAACGPSVTTVSVDPGRATLNAKDQKVTARAEPLDKEGKQVVDAILKLKWASSDPSVATVAANGVITAVKSGDAKITASVGEVSGSVAVTVSIPAKLTLEPEKSELVGVGKQVALTPKVLDDAGREVAGAQAIWSTSDGAIATIDEGMVTAAGAGTAVIKAAVGEASGTATIVITHPAVAGIALEPATHTLEKVGDAVRLKANLTDEAGQPILGLNPTWSTTDEKVATVSDTGQVQAIKRGKAVIKATVGDKVAEAQIVVK
jgi:uncharacterized protein YjdB